MGVEQTESGEAPDRDTGATSIRDLPRNLWAVSITSFFMDVSSEMVMNVLPLFLYSVLGVGTAVVGLVEGIAESLASLLKAPFGWLRAARQGR